jgi:hypothetical protein
MKEDWNSRRQYFLMTREKDHYRVQALLPRQRFFAVPPYRGPYTYSHLLNRCINTVDSIYTAYIPYSHYVNTKLYSDRDGAT